MLKECRYIPRLEKDRLILRKLLCRCERYAGYKKEEG